MDLFLCPYSLASTAPSDSISVPSSFVHRPIPLSPRRFVSTLPCHCYFSFANLATIFRVSSVSSKAPHHFILGIFTNSPDSLSMFGSCCPPSAVLPFWIIFSLLMRPVDLALVLGSLDSWLVCSQLCSSLFLCFPPPRIMFMILHSASITNPTTLQLITPTKHSSFTRTCLVCYSKRCSVSQCHLLCRSAPSSIVQVLAPSTLTMIWTISAALPVFVLSSEHPCPSSPLYLNPSFLNFLGNFSGSLIDDAHPHWTVSHIS